MAKKKSVAAAPVANKCSESGISCDTVGDYVAAKPEHVSYPENCESEDKTVENRKLSGPSIDLGKKISLMVAQDRCPNGCLIVKVS